MPAKLTHQEFLKQLAGRNNAFPVVKCLDNYQTRRVRLRFRGLCNHEWLSLPDNILRGSGCPICSGKQVKSHQRFVEQLKVLNEGRSNKVILCEQQTYKNAFTKLTFVCDKDHTWQATPNNIINSQQTCRKCSGKAKKTTEEFLQELKDKHIELQLVDNQIYINAHHKLIFQCTKNHTWSTRPIDILIGYGCPHCTKKGYSKKAIDWLTEIANSTNAFIQHAENIGEYYIPETNWYADGFCKQTNTIYEFYGDVYHGNPKIFTPVEMCHPYDKSRSAGSLYEQTQRRERKLKQLGYNIVTIWETEYDIRHCNT
jgi:hypothetical protein